MAAAELLGHGIVTILYSQVKIDNFQINNEELAFLYHFQIILVISSPSISTIGVATLILLQADEKDIWLWSVNWKGSVYKIFYCELKETFGFKLDENLFINVSENQDIDSIFI